MTGALRVAERSREVSKGIVYSLRTSDVNSKTWQHCSLPYAANILQHIIISSLADLQTEILTVI